VADYFQNSHPWRFPSPGVDEACQVLGLESREIDETALKSVYKKQALLNHPDRNIGDDDATARFQRIGEAFKVMQDFQETGRDGGSEDEYYDDEEDVGYFSARDLFATMFGRGGFGGGFIFVRQETVLPYGGDIQEAQMLRFQTAESYSP
jgi:DnaJ-class molecular chaperone